MIRSIIFTILMVMTSIVMMADPAPAVVERFYKTMEDMSAAPNESRAMDYRTELMNCFKGRESSGIWVPNDFDLWGYENEKMLTANAYSTRFYQLAYKQKKIRMTNYTIQKSHPISEVELRNFKNKSNGLIQTVVKKILSDGSTTKAFSDTLIVENGKIAVFRNALYNGEDNVDLEALRALAASYYSNKQYSKAYQTYERIIEHDPGNGNAYYRLAILTYMGKGCKHNRSKAIELAEKAYSLRYYDAERAIYYFKETKQWI